MPFRSRNQRAITPQNRGRFPGFDVLDSVDAWDDVTAGAVLARLALPGQLAFFSPHEVGVAAPMLDLLLAQDRDPRVPVLALIDERLAVGETDGWHYDTLPEDAQAWRDTLAALDDDARDAHPGRGYAELLPANRRRYCRPFRIAPSAASVARLAGQIRVEPLDAICVHGVLLAPVGVERDRLPRPRLPARLPQPRGGLPREVGGRRRAGHTTL